jgi:hypothetical protein
LALAQGRKRNVYVAASQLDGGVTESLGRVASDVARALAVAN